MTTFLTIEEAADRLRLGKGSIRNYIRSGRLPAKKLTGGKHVLIEERDLLGLLSDAQGSRLAPSTGKPPTIDEIYEMTPEQRRPFLRAAAESAYPLYLEDLARPEAERVLTADLENGEFLNYATGEMNG